ncbi:hypothetical protein ACH0R5_004387 [Vibrio vulnificus]
MNTIGVKEDEFIQELKLHFHESGKYPLELISFIPSVWKKKLIAIPSFSGDKIKFLDEVDHTNYQDALARVGAIMDKINYPSLVIERKKAHSLKFPAFNQGYKAQADEHNPYCIGASDYEDWKLGFNNRDK